MKRKPEHQNLEAALPLKSSKDNSIMNTANSTTVAATVPQFTANGAPIHPDGMLPKAQYIAWLQETGQYAPLTDEQKAERAAARAIKKAAKDAGKAPAVTAEGAPVRKPVSAAQRKFFAGYHARNRAATAAAAAAV